MKKLMLTTRLVLLSVIVLRCSTAMKSIVFGRDNLAESKANRLNGLISRYDAAAQTAHEFLHVVVTWSAGQVGSHPTNEGDGNAEAVNPDPNHLIPRNISNLATLRHPAKIILYAKGFTCEYGMRDYPGLRVAACHSTPNMGGREAHTIFLHASKNYLSLARFTMFIQDDDIPQDRGWIGRINEWITDKSLHKQTWENPHSRVGCVCNIVVEANFMPRVYGYWPAMQHGLRTYFNSSWDSTNITWPSSARFMVPRKAILRHPQATYQRVIDSGILTKLNHFANDGENCGVPSEKIIDLREKGNACPHAMGWGHVFERLWFMIW